MANELVTIYDSGDNIYAIVIYNGQFWNTSSVAFENWNASNFSNYAITLTEKGSSGIYIGDFPTAITTFSRMNVIAYRRAGGSPSTTDTKVSKGSIDWAGSFESSIITLSGLLGTNQGIRNMTYDGNSNLTGFDICLYDTSSNATTNDGSTGLVHKYTVTSVYSTNQTSQVTTQIS